MDYAPCPTRHDDGFQAEEIALRMRRSGHLIKLDCVLWRVQSLLGKFAEHPPDRFTGPSSGIRFTLPSTRQLHFYNSTESLREYIIAFLNRYKQPKGNAGILLSYDRDRGTYTRVRSPSLIDVGSINNIAWGSTPEIRTIFIEADILNWNRRQNGLAHRPMDPAQNFNTVYSRATNLYDFGLIQKPGDKTGLLSPAVCWHTSGSSKAIIVLAPTYGSLLETRGMEGAVCGLCPDKWSDDTDYVDFVHTHPKGFFIPTDRGSTTSAHFQGGIPAHRDEQNATGAWIVRVQRGEKTLHNHSFHRPKEQDWRSGIYARGRLPVDGLIPKLFARFAVEPSEEWGSHGAKGCFSAMRSFSRCAVVRMVDSRTLVLPSFHFCGDRFLVGCLFRLFSFL